MKIPMNPVFIHAVHLLSQYHLPHNVIIQHWTECNPSTRRYRLQTWQQ